MIFKNRADAGRKLAARLTRYAASHGASWWQFRFRLPKHVMSFAAKLMKSSALSRPSISRGGSVV